MTEPYPLPAYAASIWLTADALMISFPATGPDGQGSTIALSLDKCGIAQSDSGAPLPSQRGWQALLATLWLRAENGADKARDREAAEAGLRELGLL